MPAILRRMKMFELLQSKGIETSGILAKRLGVSRVQASNLWHGRDKPGIGLLKRMAEKLDIPLHELAEVEEVASSKPRSKKEPPTS